MSYNCDSVTTPVLDAWMYARDIIQLHKEHQDTGLPAVNFLQEHLEEAWLALVDAGHDARVKLRNFKWQSDWSGNAMDLLQEAVIPRIHGRIDAVFVWERGDSTTGLRIKNGKVVECDVVLSLRPKVSA